MKFTFSIEISRKPKVAVKLDKDGEVVPRPPMVSYPRKPGPIERRSRSFEDMPFREGKKIKVRQG